MVLAGISLKSRKPSGCQSGPSVNWKPEPTFSTWALSSRIACRLSLSSVLLGLAEVGLDWERDFEHWNPKSFLASVTLRPGTVASPMNNRLHIATLNIMFFMLTASNCNWTIALSSTPSMLLVTAGRKSRLPALSPNCYRKPLHDGKIITSDRSMWWWMNLCQSKTKVAWFYTRFSWNMAKRQKDHKLAGNWVILALIALAIDS